MRNIKISQKSHTVIKKTSLLSVAGILAVSSIVGLARPTFADQYDDQIRALQSQIDNYNQQSAALHAQADSLQNAIAELTAEKGVIQGQIDLSQAKHDQLVAQIVTTQQKIAATQAVLASTIADMYVDSKTTPLEMVASSSNISDYVNAEQYNDVASEQIQSSIKQIKSLKVDLEKQQKEVDQVLADQQAQREVLQQKTDEQNTLLAQTQGSEAAYQGMISSANSSISSIRAQQAAAYAAYTRSHSGNMYGAEGNGGYPDKWANAAQDTVIDDWGMYNRECVSYVAWKIWSTGRNMPYWGGRGNAYQWIQNANNAGIPTRVGAPKEGSAVVWGINQQGMGPVGHIAYVEIVNSDGSIEVSQYNVIHGKFNRMHVDAGSASALTYLYF